MTDRYRFGRFTFDAATGRLLHADGAEQMPGRAAALLRALLTCAGREATAAELIRAVWPHAGATDGTLRAQIAAVRKLLGDEAALPRFIATVPGGYRFIPRVEVPDVPKEEAPGAAARPAPAPLQASPQGLVGRADALAALGAHFTRDRLITLAGPGGIGKSALARAAAGAHAALFPSGIFFVDLGAARDAEALAAALAAALGVPAGGAMLHEGRCLIVFDCCEALLPDVAGTSRALLAAHPALVILCTSREPLAVPCEAVMRLQPMSMPPGAPRDAGEAMRFSAVELFERRAEASLQGFAVTDANAATVAAICRHLDGIPLAIEIAAALVGALGLSNLLRRLAQGRSLLDLQRHALDPRHASLRTALDGSFSLLDPTQRAILLSLSVFARSFDFDAAVAVCGAPPHATARAVRELAAKSLLVADASGVAAPYRLLDVTRGYLREQWRSTPACAETRLRHAQHMLAFSQAAGRPLDARTWAQRHGGRLDDVTAAMEWCASQAATLPLACELAYAAGPLYFHASRPLEFQSAAAMIAAAVERQPDFPPAQRLNLQVAIDRLDWTTRQPGPAHGKTLADTLRAVEGSRQTALRIEATRHLWREALMLGDYALSLQHAQRARALARASGDAASAMDGERMVITASAFAGRLHATQETSARHMAAARGAPESSRFMALDEIHDKATCAFLMLNLGRPEAARQLWGACAARAVQAEHLLSLLYVACGLFLLESWTGDFVAARRETDRIHGLLAREAHPYWQAWADCFELILVTRGAVGASAQLPPAAGQLLGVQRDYLAINCPASVTAQQVARVRAGAPSWCAPEVLRAHAVNLIALHGQAARPEARRALAEAAELADAMDARFWSLRVAGTAVLLAPPEDAVRARTALVQALARCPEAHATADARAARRLLDDSTRMP